MSSSEQQGTQKRSPLFGVSRTRIKSLDEGVRKTIDNAIQRWTEKRIEFIQNLPEVTQEELRQDGFLQAPEITLAKQTGSRAPAPQQQGRAPMTGLAGATHLQPNGRGRL